jgi:hypothetical protein
MNAYERLWSQNAIDGSVNNEHHASEADFQALDTKLHPERST